MLVLFLLLILLCSSAQSMEQEESLSKDNIISSAKEDFKALVDFENLDATLEKVATSIPTNIIGEAKLKVFFNSKIIDQWRETIYLTEKPRKVCAVGPLIAWLSKKDPKKCFYINRRCNDEVCTIQLKKPIKHIDIAPNAVKIALTSHSNIEVWNINKFKKVFKTDCSPNIITALVFYKYNKMFFGTDNGYVRCINFNKKFTETKTLELPDSNRSAITALAVADDFVISQDLQGIVTTRIIFSESRMKSNYEKHTSQYNLILPFGTQNWAAATKSGGLYMNIFEPLGHMTIEVTDAGSLIGKTRFDEYVLYQPKLDTKKDSGFKICALGGKLHNEIAILEGVLPVVQKPNISEGDCYEDYIPGYFIYEEDKERVWTLIRKETPTYKQLAYRLILAEAYEQKNIEALEKLFAHEQFKSFGSYMQKLLLSEYKIDFNDGTLH